MALLSDISGLRGENLASALLAHLLLRSEPIRRAIVSQISSLSKKGPIIVEKNFAVFTEVATDEKKRVDILIQTDNAIVGIENKFSARFQVNQPKSYLGLVESKARELGEVWPSSFQALLVILAPENRKEETDDRISEQQISDSCVFLSWQELLACLSRDRLPDLPQVDRFLVNELAQYADIYMGTVDLTQLMEHIDNPWQERGSAVVKDVFNSVIWPLIDERLRDSNSYSGGAYFYGYYLRNDHEDRPWIGFIDRKSLPSGGEGAALVVALRSEPIALNLANETGYELVPIWEGWYCVSLPYMTRCKQQSDWQEMMNIVNETISGSRD